MNDLRILISSLNRIDIEQTNTSVPPFIEVDVFQDSAELAVNYNSLDIRDITKRKANFTKSIKLPGTKKNNEFFKTAFDVNINLEYFNPRISRSVVILVGDNEILRGKFQLTNIIVENGDVTYECTVFGNLKTLFDSIKGKFLQELVGPFVSELNHQRTAENIIYNISNNGGLLDINSNPITNSEFVYYPKIEYGRIENVFYQDNAIGSGQIGGFTILQPYEYNPALSAKYIWDKIFESIGLTYSSSFIESQEFERLALPYVGEGLKADPQEFLRRTTTIGLEGIRLFALLSQQWDNNRSVVDTFTLNNMSRTTGGIDDPVSNEAIEFRDDEGNWDAGTFVTNGTRAQKSFFTAPRSANYTIEVNLPIFPQYSNDGNDVEYRDGYIEYQWALIKRDVLSGAENTLARSENIDNPNDPWLEVRPSTGRFPSGYEDRGSLDFSIQTTVEGERLLQGDEVFLRIAMNNNRGDRFGGNDGIRWRTIGGSRDVTVDLRIYDVDVNIGAAYFDVRPATNVPASYDDFIDMNQAMPKMTAEDFVIDIIKMFNLVVVDDKYNENNLIIEPVDEYYAQSKIVEDWCIDEDSPIEIQPFSDIDFNAYEYKYAEDGDYLNKDYNETRANALTYGSRRQELFNDFSNKTGDLNLKFAPTPTFGISKNIFAEEPYFTNYDGTTNTFTPRVVKPRLVYINNEILTPLNYGIQDETGFVNSLDRYLEASMVYKDNGFPFPSLEFARPLPPYYSSARANIEFNPGVNNLFDRFHKNTFLELADSNSKILTGFFRLTPRQINDWEFNDIIFLKGQYWRVNQIFDYNPNARDTLTKVELIRVASNVSIVDDFQLQTGQGLEIYDICSPDKFDFTPLFGNFYTVDRTDGQQVSNECCRYLTGNNVRTDGTCLGIGPIPTFSSHFETPSSANGTGTVADIFNPNQIKANNVTVLGNNNKVKFGSTSLAVYGDDNYIPPAIKNTLVVGDNIIVNDTNSIYLGDIRIDSQGVIHNERTYIIDGGEDTVLPYNKTNPIDILDGGEDSVRNFGGFAQTRVIIDGNNKI